MFLWGAVEAMGDGTGPQYVGVEGISRADFDRLNEQRESFPVFRATFNSVQKTMVAKLVF